MLCVGVVQTFRVAISEITTDIARPSSPEWTTTDRYDKQRATISPQPFTSYLEMAMKGINKTGDVNITGKLIIWHCVAEDIVLIGEIRD